MKIIHGLQNIFNLDDYPFVIELYRQLLNRAPDESGFYTYLNALQYTTKFQVAAFFWESDEFKKLVTDTYQLLTPDLSAKKQTLIEKTKGIFNLEGREYIIKLYQEILNRTPSEEELLYYLNSEDTKFEIMLNFFKSAEAMMLYEKSFNRVEYTLIKLYDRLLSPWWKELGTDQ